MIADTLVIGSQRLLDCFSVLLYTILRYFITKLKKPAGTRVCNMCHPQLVNAAGGKLLSSITTTRISNVGVPKYRICTTNWYVISYLDILLSHVYLALI